MRGLTFVQELFYKHVGTNVIVLRIIVFPSVLGLQVSTHSPVSHQIHMFPYNKSEICLSVTTVFVTFLTTDSYNGIQFNRSVFFCLKLIKINTLHASYQFKDSCLILLLTVPDPSFFFLNKLFMSESQKRPTFLKTSNQRVIALT